MWDRFFDPINGDVANFIDTDTHLPNDLGACGLKHLPFGQL